MPLQVEAEIRGHKCECFRKKSAKGERGGKVWWLVPRHSSAIGVRVMVSESELKDCVRANGRVQSQHEQGPRRSRAHEASTERETTPPSSFSSKPISSDGYDPPEAEQIVCCFPVGQTHSRPMEVDPGSAGACDEWKVRLKRR